MNNGYAICLNEWIFDQRIKTELNLLLYISSLTAENGYCFAKNEHFSEKFGEHETSISRKIKKLESLGYINVEYIKRGCEVKERYIRLAKMLTDDQQKCEPTISKNAKDNIIINNNTSINNKEIYKESFETFWKEYPKQRIGNKDKAYSSYCRAIKEKRATEEQILEAAKAYAKSDEVKRGYAKGCQAWLNDDRFNVAYAKPETETPKEKKTVKIETGVFFLDNVMPEYKDVTIGMTDDQCERLWKWIYDKYLGQELEVDAIRDMIARYNKRNLTNG